MVLVGRTQADEGICALSPSSVLLSTVLIALSQVGKNVVRTQSEKGDILRVVRSLCLKDKQQ